MKEENNNYQKTESEEEAEEQGSSSEDSDYGGQYVAERLAPSTPSLPAKEDRNSHRVNQRAPVTYTDSSSSSYALIKNI